MGACTMFLSSIRLLLVRCHWHKGAYSALSPTLPLPPIPRGVMCVAWYLQSPGQDMVLMYEELEGLTSDLWFSLFNVNFELQRALKNNSEADASLIFKSVLITLFQMYCDVNDSARKCDALKNV